MGSNASWDISSFTHSLDPCQKLEVPFISLHGSLSNYSKTTLPELKGWTDTMLLPLASMEEKVLYRNIVGSVHSVTSAWWAPY